MALISKYLKQDAITQIAEEGLKTRQGVNKVIDYINTGGTQATVLTDEVVELMGRTAAEIKAATTFNDPSGNPQPLETGKYAIDNEGVTHMFVKDAALAGTEPEKQWHEINMGITQAQADARYAQLGTTEFAPKFKLGNGGFGTQWAIGDPNFGAMKNGQEFIIDFDPANITTVGGWDALATSNDTSAFFVVPDIDALSVANNPLVPLPAGGGAYTLPTLRDGAGAFLLPKFRGNYKANTFRFKKQLKAGKTEATATWDDWEYVFVKLEPKIVPVKHIMKQYANWTELMVDKDEITTLMLRPKAQIDWYGAAIRIGAWMPLQPTFPINGGFTGASNMSNNTEYVTQAKAGGLVMYNQGAAVGGATAYITWDKFDIFAIVTVGNALTSAGGSGMLMGNLGEIYDIENGRGVAHAIDKVLNIQEIAELIKDQRDIDKNFMATFRDRITYSDAKTFTYDDLTRTQLTPGGAFTWEKSGLASYTAPVTVSGTSITYDNLVNPYNRIVQEQASFEGTFKVANMSVEYKFFATNKAVKFSGNVDQTYKWETFGKFENNARIPYIRFSGTGTMAIANDALNPVYTDQALPYEMKLADLMPNTDAGRTAIVKMNFGTLPAVGTEIMEIDYVTSTLFVENRFKNFLGAISAEVNAIKTDVANKADVNLANANVGTANANKLPRVKADGTLEYIDNDLSTVNVGTGNAGKIIRVKADGTLEYVETHDAAVTYDDNSTGIWKVIKG